MRRLAIVLLGTAALVGLAGSANAQTDDPDDPTCDDSAPLVNDPLINDPLINDPGPAPVDVLQVDGFLDDILVSEIGNAIDRADAEGSQALILQVDSRGAVVPERDMIELLQRIADSPITIGVWVGPSGARLYGQSAQMLGVADVTGMAPGARVGHTGPLLQLPDATVEFGDAAPVLRNRSLGLSDARELGVFRQRISDQGIATIVNMVDALDGYEKNGTVLRTTVETVTDEGTVQRDTVATVRFAKLGLVDQLFHTVASPPVAYLLLLIGMALIVFEFYTAGIGIAGVVGAGSLVLAAYGLAALPTRGWAVALLVIAMVAFAIDVQVGLPRVWTGVGVALTIVGSWSLFEPLPGTSPRPSWITLVAGVGGVMLAFIVGMPSMVRTRFATPTIGREWMIGEVGSVVERVGPEGIVEVNDGRWRARTNRATPVEPGEQVRVVAIDGITLEVEPLDGAARDYREMRGSTADSAN
ncbi:nodulation protein NfeD [soil metagenome]